MTTSPLYKKISHGDRQTIARRFEAGHELSTKTDPPQTVVITSPVMAKVTQEYDAYKRQWNDVAIHIDSMVEACSERVSRPAPIPMPIPMPRDIFEENIPPKVKKSPLPKAEVRQKQSLWKKIFG